MKPQVFGALAACAALTATLAAHQTPAPQAPAAKPPRPVVPLAATTLAADPSRYVGSPVSITAPVDGAIGDSAFSMKGVLVLAPILTAPVKPGAYVTVIGDVVRFDPAAIATRMKESMPVLPPGGGEISGPARDDRHVGHQRGDDGPREKAAAADVARRAEPE